MRGVRHANGWFMCSFQARDRHTFAKDRDTNGSRIAIPQVSQSGVNATLLPKGQNFSSCKCSNVLDPLKFVICECVLLSRTKSLVHKGGFPKGWFWRMFPRNGNWNEGTFGCSPGTEIQNEDTFACSPGTKTGMRVHSPKPPFYETALLSPLDKGTASVIL